MSFTREAYKAEIKIIEDSMKDKDMEKALGRVLTADRPYTYNEIYQAYKKLFIRRGERWRGWEFPGGRLPHSDWTDWSAPSPGGSYPSPGPGFPSWPRIDWECLAAGPDRQRHRFACRHWLVRDRP